MKFPFPNPAADSRVEGSSSAARSGYDDACKRAARSVDPPEEGRQNPSPVAPPSQYDLPDPHYGDDLAYAEYWEDRIA